MVAIFASVVMQALRSTDSAGKPLSAIHELSSALRAKSILRLLDRHFRARVHELHDFALSLLPQQ